MDKLLPFSISVHHLRFTLQAVTGIKLGIHAGAQLRGALWHAFESLVCPNQILRKHPDHQRHCPACRLFALETDSPRGLNPPRPFVVQPPLGTNPTADKVYQPGETFTIGINLFGNNVDVFPYLCQAIYQIGNTGVGYGRGRFKLKKAFALNPITGAEQDLVDNHKVIALPNIPITNELIMTYVNQLNDERIKLDFLTPTQLKGSNNQYQVYPDFGTLIARLLERCQALETYYTDSPQSTDVWHTRYQELTSQAAQCICLENKTQWIKSHSRSSRVQRMQDISGFVGCITFQGEMALFHPWLLWGESLHIGKNAVKGNGWYRIVM